MSTSNEPRTSSLRTLAFASGLTGFALLVGYDPAQAQVTWGAGWSAGASHVTEMNPDAAAGAVEVSPGTGFVFGLFADRWIGTDQRFGVRAQASYQQPRFDWATGERKIDTGSVDATLLVRPVVPEDGSVLPYLGLGAGAIWYDLGTTETDFPQAGAFHDGRSRILPTGVVALGVDFSAPFDWHRLPVSVRLEAADHITVRSPLKRVTDGERHSAVHHLRFTIGLYSTLRRW
jgi:hypothetical protein